MAQDISVKKTVLSPILFIRQVGEELRHVTWPSRQTTIQSTTIVVVLSILVGAYVGGLDFLLTKAIGLFLK